MNEIFLPSLEQTKKLENWIELLKNYLQGLQNIPASTLNLTLEELGSLQDWQRLAYQNDTVRFNNVRNEPSTDGDESRRLLPDLVEQILTRHNTLSMHWPFKQNNPKIFKTSPPDDLGGIDFVVSFSGNIDYASDITLAGKESIRGNKKLKRRDRYERTFKQATVVNWRAPRSGKIWPKKFPFLPLYISASQAIDFVEKSAASFQKPFNSEYQGHYQHFFSDIMHTAIDEAKIMQKNILDNIINQGHLPLAITMNIQSVLDDITTTDQNKIDALGILRKSIPEGSEDYFSLLIKYQSIIHRTNSGIASSLK